MPTNSLLRVLLLAMACKKARAFSQALSSHGRFATGRVAPLCSDWGGFGMIDDDEDVEIDRAALGAADVMIPVPSASKPIMIPQGSMLPLTEENVEGILAACREEIGTMFGYTVENRGVGITGAVDFVEMDGPIVMLSLRGRFWHERTTVLDRCKAYIMGRIPEVIDVCVGNEWELTQEANEEAL